MRVVEGTTAAAGEGGGESLDEPPTTAEALISRGDRIRRRTLPELLVAIELGEPAVDTSSIETILPETVPEGETYELLIRGGRLTMALASLYLGGVRDLGGWTDAVESVLRRRLVGGDIRARLRDIRNHIRSHHKQMEAGEWQPYLPVSLTPDDVARCESLAASIVGARAGSGRRRDSTTVRDILLSIIVRSRRADEMDITQDQWVEHLGWVEPDSEHDSRASEDARKRLRRNLSVLVAHGLLTCTQVGSPGNPSIYAIHWDRWRVDGA